MDSNSTPTDPGATVQVACGLNLTLELREPLEMPLLLAGLKSMLPQVHGALKELYFVHYARFLPVRGNTALLVITEFDGPLQAYVMDFVIAIGDAFTFILKFVKDGPPLPVQHHPREFWEFVKLNNRVVVLPPLLEWDNYPLYSAYPDQTVIDIVGRRSGLPPPAVDALPVDIDLHDVQGNILRGFHAQMGHHYALCIRDKVAARAFLSELVDGGGKDLPCLSSAKLWPSESSPEYLLNVGITAAGLNALGVEPSVLRQFPTAFLEGPANPHRATANGDTGESAPSEWELGAPGQEIHLLVSLYAKAHREADFAKRQAQLSSRWQPGRLELVKEHRVDALPGEYVHFGYKDGIAQPNLAGAPRVGGEDMQPAAHVGEFLMGASYPNIYGGPSLQGLPAELCSNAAFAAIRLLDQDVQAFEQMLDRAQQTTQLDRALIAAKLLGRWQDGTPLSLSPAALTAGAAKDLSNSNAFDYAPSPEHPTLSDDHEGLRCPVGAHIRRMNPRSSLVAGSPHSRRLIRRGMPYGPAWAEGGDPGVRRGLYGVFICGDLERQYEFLLQVWANGDTSARSIRGTLDPFLGAQPPSGGEFRFPLEEGAKTVTLTVPRLLTTRGSLYVLMPGLNGLRHLVSMGEVTTPAEVSSPVADTPETTAPRASPLSPFDPKDPAFLADPYPFYARFRQQSPVALVQHGSYKSYWVFTHELVTQVCDDTAGFLKRPQGETGDRGLFFMDPPRHEQARAVLDPMFATSIADCAASAGQLADEAITAIRAGGPTFDLVSAYANRVTRNVFMTMFGIPESAWDRIGGWVNTVLEHFDQMLPKLQRAPAAAASMALLGDFYLRHFGCPAHPTSTALINLMNLQGREQGLHESEITQTALHFALGGYLSTQFLVSSGVHNLLVTPGAMQNFRSNSAPQRLQAIEEMKRFDAPFQMADRYAAQETVLAGCRIPAGAMVTVVYGSANRDEVVFGGDADQFRPDRVTPRDVNFVFGHGIHRCIGAPMVAEVAPVVFGKLIGAMPNLALGGVSPTRLPDPYYRAFSRLELKG